MPVVGSVWSVRIAAKKKMLMAIAFGEWAILITSLTFNNSNVVER